MGTSGSEPLIVVTGGTGVVGSALLPNLIQRYPNRRVLLLTRNPDQVRQPGVATLRADFCHPGMGLPGDAARELQRKTSIFVHCGANTRFDLQLSEARAFNVEGTRRAIQFALACPRIEQFAHISTLYIAGRRAGLVTETRLQHDWGYFNAYEESKHEAENVVFEEAQRLPAAIYRLSSLIGENSGNGHVRQLIKLVPRADQFPFIPAIADAPVDLIAADWAGEALAALIASGSEAGGIYHLCAGHINARTVQELIDRVFTAYERIARKPAPRPQLMALPDFDRHMGRIDRQSQMWRTMQTLRTFLPHLGIAQPFDCSRTADTLGRIGVKPPNAGDVFDRILKAEFRPPC